jgi:fused signal recognition particle receptor
MLLAAISSSTVLAVVVLVALLVLGVALVARKRGQSSQAAGSAAVVTPASPTADEQQVAESGQVGVASSSTQSASTQAEAVVESATIVAPLQTPEAVGPTVEAPESADQRANRLRSRLSKSQGGLGQSLRALFSGGDIAGETWDDLEDTLIMSDVGVTAAGLVIDRLKSAIRSAGAHDAAAVDALVRQELTQIIDGGFDRSLKTSRHDDRPAIMLTVGVNGTGKTTTTGKLARLLVSQDQDVLLGAADTFRAAAAEQLTTWGDRIGVPVVRGPEGSDPASVAFDAVNAGVESQADVVLIDTAGRLHTKQGLMDELGKVYRVASKAGSIDEVLLVIDATTGQNGLLQAKVFSEVVPVSGVVLTKLDGTAKGGIILAIQNELGVPVKLVGLGEGPDDLAAFNPAQFVDGLFA